MDALQKAKFIISRDLTSLKLGGEELTAKQMNERINKSLSIYDTRWQIKLSGLESSMDAQQTAKNLESELQKAYKNLIEATKNVLEDKKFNNYNFTNLIDKVSNYEALLRSIEVAKIKAKETEYVENMFGSFTNKKQVINKKGKIVEVYKTSQELTEERNNRLAILQRLHAKKVIGDEEYINKVVSVRRFYQREIEKHIVAEAEQEKEHVKQSNTPTAKLKSKFKAIANKICSVFKLGKPAQLKYPKEDIQALFNRGSASEGLLEVSRLLNNRPDAAKSSVQVEISECFNEYINTCQGVETSFAPEALAEISLMLKAREREISKRMGTNIPTAKEHQIAVLEYGRIHPGKNLYAEDPDKLIQQKEDFINSLIKRYNPAYVLPKGSSAVANAKLTFQNPTIQKMYEQAIKVFDANITLAKQFKENNCSYNLSEQASKIAEEGVQV